MTGQLHTVLCFLADLPPWHSADPRLSAAALLLVITGEVCLRLCQRCPQCNQNRTSRRPAAGFLHPLPVPQRPWSHISLDFVTGLPTSKGHTAILTVVDRFSKMVHFIPLSKLPSVKETAELVLQNIFRLHGLPTDIVSDRGPQFTSMLWKEFFSLARARDRVCLLGSTPSQMGRLRE